MRGEMQSYCAEYSDQLSRNTRTPQDLLNVDAGQNKVWGPDFTTNCHFSRGLNRVPHEHTSDLLLRKL